MREWRCDGLQTAMLEAEKSFRRLKAHKQLPILRAALLRH
jgi:hypothetical protein